MFLRYFEGAKPGKRRQESQKPATDVSQAKKAYEQKREGNFLCSWQKSRPWLVYDEPANIMYCSTCRSTSVPENDTVFVKGTNSFRLDGIKNHEISDIHVKASQKLAAKSIPISQSVGAKCLQHLKKAENDRLIILMRNAHAVAKHNLSLKSYELLCKLDKAKGLDVGSSYLNDKAAATFTESIASTTRASLIQKVNNCDYCSFTCDGSTDFTGDDMESLYLRTSTKGIIEDTFMFIGCPESASSEDIYLYIKGVFNKLKLESQIKNKLVGFCADGASNMQGNKTGLAALLRKDWPHLLVTHCLAHRLELAFKDTVKKASPKLYEKTTTLLLGLYYYYHKSPKEKKGLLRAFEMLQVKQNLPTRIGGTRWLPHYERAINVFVKAYKVLRFHLESSSHRNAKAEGLAKLLQDGNVVVYILTLKDAEVFEITDFTTASEWERFISRVEEILHEWKLVSTPPKPPAPKGLYTNGSWEERTETLAFADFKFSLTHCWLKSKDEKTEKSAEKESGEEDDDNDKEITPTVHGDLMNMENDFPSRAHCICRWYGLQDFVTLSPTNNTEAVLGESRAKLLLSSVNIALTDAGCSVPVFVQIHQKWRRLYQGTCVLPGSNIEFAMVHLKRTPAQYNHLAGLLDVFKSKLASVADPRPPVSVAVRFLYMLYDWVNSPWTQPLPDYDDEVGCSGFEQLPFGACEDPVSALSLYCTWPSLSEDMIVENQVYSDLDPLQAPHWSVRIQMTEDPQCLLGEYLINFLALCHRKETLDQLIGGFGSEMRESDSTGEISNALQKLTEPSVGYNIPSLTSYVSQPQKQASKTKDAPIQGELLDQIVQFLFPDAAKPMSADTTGKEEEDMRETTPQSPKELPKQLKSSQVDGLLHKLAVCLCVLNHNHGGVCAVAQIWQEFILEMRYRWENNFFIEGIEKGPPNLGSCLLQQKLQMLNCCIEHKKKREQLHKGYTGVPDSPPNSPYRGPSTSQVSRSMSHEDIFIDQSETNVEHDNDRSRNQVQSSAHNAAEQSSNPSAIRKLNKTGSLKLASSGESSDEEEFFECNDDENNPSGEEVEDTSAGNQTAENLQQMQDENQSDIDGNQTLDNGGNQSATEMECEQVNISQTSSQNTSLTDSQIREMTGSGQRQSVSNVSITSDTAFKESYSHKPEGRLAPFQDLKLVNCEEKMYIPITQEPAPMTEDMLEEHAEVLAKLGTSAEGAELRARMQSACLLSDMESFKAANPGCVLDDFVRWYSPRDWIEEAVEDDNGDIKIEGHLSQRMQIPGNVWVEVWQTARPVPARHQKRLFDDTKEAEKVLHFLSSLKPADVVVHLMPMLIHAALLKAMENDDPKIPVLKQVIEQACTKASQVTRSPNQDAKRYEELIRMVMQAEIIIARNLSLQSKFTSELLDRPDAKEELEHFVATILQNSEVPVRGGPMGPAGNVISKLFQAAQRASYMILDEDDSGETKMEDDEDSRLNSSVPNFPRPSAREYILRTFVPRPAPYSKQLPHRLFCCIEEEEFRIAGAFSSDSVFQ